MGLVKDLCLFSEVPDVAHPDAPEDVTGIINAAFMEVVDAPDLNGAFRGLLRDPEAPCRDDAAEVWRLEGSDPAELLLGDGLTPDLFLDVGLAAGREEFMLLEGSLPAGVAPWKSVGLDGRLLDLDWLARCLDGDEVRQREATLKVTKKLVSLDVVGFLKES